MKTEADLAGYLGSWPPGPALGGCGDMPVSPAVSCPPQASEVASHCRLRAGRVLSSEACFNTGSPGSLSVRSVCPVFIPFEGHRCCPWQVFSECSSLCHLASLTHLQLHFCGMR